MNFLLLAFLYIWCPAKVKNNPRKKVIELRSRNPCAKENSATNQNSKPKPKMIRPVIEFSVEKHYAQFRAPASFGDDRVEIHSDLEATVADHRPRISYPSEMPTDAR